MKVTGKWILRIAAVLSDLITIGLFIQAHIAWTMNNIFCNPYFRIVLVSLLVTAAVFVIDPIFKRFTRTSILFKVAIYMVVIVGGLFGISRLPKGDCYAAAIPNSNVPKVAPATIPDSVKTQDTSIIRPKTVAHSPKQYAQHPATTQIQKPVAAPDTSKGRSKFDLSKSTFNGPTQIGDGNTQNNFGPQPRKITDDDPFIRIFLDNIQDKNTIIALRYWGSQDVEMTDYMTQIRAILRRNGYQRVSDKPMFAMDVTGYSGHLTYQVKPDSSVIINVEPNPAH